MSWEPDEGGLAVPPPGHTWMRFMGGPLDGRRMLGDGNPPKTFLHMAPPDPPTTRYVRQPTAEQFDFEAIYYPEEP
jgi:hypothetical protein